MRNSLWTLLIGRATFGGVIASLALLACDPANDPANDATTQDLTSATSTNAVALQALNEGVGLMGKFDFTQAAVVFERIAKAPNAPAEAALDQAIATLNGSHDGAQEDAIKLLTAFIATKPSKDLTLRAQYCTGLCQLYLGRASEAVAMLTLVATARSDDAFVQYFAGQAIEQAGDATKALEYYERASNSNPLLKSAQLGIQRCARKLGKDDQAESALASFETLAKNPRATSAEFKYTRLGPFALAVVGPTPPKSVIASSRGPYFADERELTVHWPEGYDPQWSSDIEQHAVSADLNNDARLDIIIVRGVTARGEDGSDEEQALVLLQREDGSFDAQPGHSFGELAGPYISSLLMGDINADGRVDAYVCRNGGNRLLLALSDGSFEDVTLAARAAGETTTCIDGALADLDHDGDLDLYLISREGLNELLANNGDGTFRSIGVDARVAVEGRFARAVIVGDFDYDRDADIFVLNEHPPHDLFLNHRDWTWIPGTTAGISEKQLAEPAITAAFVEIADLPLRRLVLATTSYLQFPARAVPITPSARIDMEFSDLNGDGVMELVLAQSKSIAILDEAGRELASLPVADGVVHSQLITIDPVHGPSLLALRTGKGPLIRTPHPSRAPYMAADFRGRDDPSQSMRSNTSGIGTSYAARVGSTWVGGQTFRSHSGRGQSLAPVSIGVGGNTLALGADRGIAAGVDFLDIEWSDGVLQSEIAMAANELHRITETQRQISSCPVVFAFDGTRMSFVTDVLGVGGLGYLLEPGVYSTPRPWEVLVLPSGALVEQAGGTLALAIAEPMEESCMLDSVRLRAIDLPAGWNIAPDERLSIAGAAPTGEIVAWQREFMPTASAALAAVDGVALDPGALDSRFIGRLAGEHTIELEFDLASEPSIDTLNDPWLVIDGWVEYPYCQTMFAAWQAGAKYTAPSLEARAADGSWTTLVTEWGYPAGMPRRMALPIPKNALPKGTTALRMRTTMEIYFDSVRLIDREALPVSIVECELTRANLASVGFAKRSTFAQKRPFYDRSIMLPLWDCRFQYGMYTELGDVRELLTVDDDALAVFGPGEEIALHFRAPSIEQQPGTTRRYVLVTAGWCKDMDLFTKDGETIEPLPSLASEAPRNSALREKLRTRPMGGR